MHCLQKYSTTYMCISHICRKPPSIVTIVFSEWFICLLTYYHTLDKGEAHCLHMIAEHIWPANRPYPCAFLNYLSCDKHVQLTSGYRCINRCCLNRATPHNQSSVAIHPLLWCSPTPSLCCGVAPPPSSVVV